MSALYTREHFLRPDTGQCFESFFGVFVIRPGEQGLDLEKVMFQPGDGLRDFEWRSEIQVAFQQTLDKCQVTPLVIPGGRDIDKLL